MKKARTLISCFREPFDFEIGGQLTPVLWNPHIQIVFGS